MEKYNPKWYPVIKCKDNMLYFDVVEQTLAHVVKMLDNKRYEYPIGSEWFMCLTSILSAIKGEEK